MKKTLIFALLATQLAGCSTPLNPLYEYNRQQKILADSAVSMRASTIKNLQDKLSMLRIEGAKAEKAGDTKTLTLLNAEISKTEKELADLTTQTK